MIKRYMTILMILILLYGNASASQQTKCRNAFEFTELCMQRIEVLNSTIDSKYKIVIKPMGINLEQSLMRGEKEVLLASTSLAHFYMARDLSIDECTVVMSDSTDSENDNFINLFKAVVVFSALEYSYSDDEDIKMMFKYGISDDYYDAIDKAWEIVIKSIFPTATDASSIKKYAYDKQPVFVYSGNYDWSIEYYSYTFNEKTHNQLLLVANSR